jgi:hypothetical protein
LKASSKNPGLPGLVFDDFDQLYTQILDKDLLQQHTLEESVDLEEPEESEYDFKFPDAEKELEGKKSDLHNPENKTTALIEYINDIDYKTIVAIQKQTDKIYQYEEDAKTEIQKYSNAFRRDKGCMSKIKTDYRNVMMDKIGNGGINTNCLGFLFGVKFFC